MPNNTANSLLLNNDENQDDPDSPQTQIPDDDVIQVLPLTNQSKRPGEEGTEQQKSSSKKPAKRANDVQKRLLDIEEEKLNFFKQRRVETVVNDDYDQHFLMGLLPHLKKVKPERKLIIQSQLQQVLLNEMLSYKPEPSQPTTFLNPQFTPSPSSTQSGSYILSLQSPSSPSVSNDDDVMNYNITQFVESFKGQINN